MRAYIHKIHLLMFLLVWLLIASGCVSSIMMQSEIIDQPDSNHALVTIFRPASGDKSGHHGFWDGENYIGDISWGTFIQYMAAPGEHIFLISFKGRSDSWWYVKADLKEGKNYYMVFDYRSGKGIRNITYLYPISNNDYLYHLKIADWMNDLMPVAAKPSERDGYEKKHIAEARKAIKSYIAGNPKVMILEANDYWPLDQDSFPVRLHSQVLPDGISRDGKIASIQFESKIPLDFENIALVLDYQVNKMGVSKHTRYLYHGKTPIKLGISSGFFSISSKQPNKIFFPFYNPVVKGSITEHYPISGGVRIIRKQVSFRLSGRKEVSIYLIRCQETTCNNKRLVVSQYRLKSGKLKAGKRISNSIDEIIKFNDL